MKFQHLIAASAAALLLMGCGQAATETDITAHEEAGHHTMETLPREHRLAFMMGHVEAGLALYRAGAPEMAAPHLLHPVSETHAAERAGLDELGFQGELFEAVSKALEEGRPASEVEPQLRAAEANLQDVANRAGGDPAGIVSYLMDVIDEEYEIALTDGVVTDPGEYQDAYGFAVVAKQRASDMPDVIAAIDTLLTHWPEGGPIPPSDPTSVEKIKKQTNVIRGLL